MPNHVNLEEPGTRRVLAVYDSMIFLNSLADILSPHGYEVVKAGSISEAVQSLKQVDVGLVLTQIIIIGGANGKELSEIMKGEGDTELWAEKYFSGDILDYAQFVERTRNLHVLSIESCRHATEYAGQSMDANVRVFRKPDLHVDPGDLVHKVDLHYRSAKERT